MKTYNYSSIQVYYVKATEQLFMGRLAIKERKIFFEYTSDFLKTGLNLSPFKLPLRAGVMVCQDQVFDGLFGVFNDSLPDGWGRLLLDRKLAKQGIDPYQLSPLDRLQYVGSHGMGALVYAPEEDGHDFYLHATLDEIGEEILQFQEHEEDRFMDDLFAMNGSSCGARPKIVVRIGSIDWIIKYCSIADPKDIGAIEYAYHLMAKAAKLELPKAKLFPSKKRRAYFGVERFDRIGNKRLHMHTLSGLLHADHRLPSLDYAAIIKATLWLTRDQRECEKQYRVAVFNVLAHNRDDHAKNFSFLMDADGVWRVSPAYDLVFSYGPAGEHSTMIMGEGKNPTKAHLLQLATVAGIKTARALQIIAEVKAATSKWSQFAMIAGVSKKSAAMIQKKLDWCQAQLV